MPFDSPAMVMRVRAEVDDLRFLGLIERLPLLRYKLKIALHALGKESHDLETLDQHLLVAQRTGERWGVHCSFGAIPLSRIPPG